MADDVPPDALVEPDPVVAEEQVDADPNPNVFLATTHCTKEIQIRVGLLEPECKVPKAGDRTAWGVQSPVHVCSRSHMKALTEAEADAIWALVPDASKTDADMSHALANGLSKLAEASANAINDQIRARCTPPIRNDNKQLNSAVGYVSLGSPLFVGFKNSLKFISFLNLNQDDASRVPWSNMTGREQFEWYRAFARSNYTHLRHEAETVGLRGTDLSRITTIPQLTACIHRTPSLKRRRTDAHPITEQEWTTATDQAERQAVQRQLQF